MPSMGVPSDDFHWTSSRDPNWNGFHCVSKSLSNFGAKFSVEDRYTSANRFGIAAVKLLFESL